MDELKQVLAKERISDYLTSRGVEIHDAGSKQRCLCPIHENDSDPSFYIGQFSSGADYFKCFGCQASGNLLSLQSLLEKKPIRIVVKELLHRHGIEASTGNIATLISFEPPPHEVVGCFCEEDNLVAEIATYARTYLRVRNGCTDAVNKVSRLYKKLNELSEVRDFKGMHRILRSLKELMTREGTRREKHG